MFITSTSNNISLQVCLLCVCVHVCVCVCACVQARFFVCVFAVVCVILYSHCECWPQWSEQASVEIFYTQCSQFDCVPAHQ